MWEIIAGAAAGVIGVVVAWVGIGIGSGYLVLDPYEERRQERRRLQRERRGETDVAREEKLAYGLKSMPRSLILLPRIAIVRSLCRQGNISIH
jgi:hypothetical protein